MAHRISGAVAPSARVQVRRGTRIRHLVMRPGGTVLYGGAAEGGQLGPLEPDPGPVLPPWEQPPWGEGPWPGPPWLPPEDDPPVEEDPPKNGGGITITIGGSCRADIQACFDRGCREGTCRFSDNGDYLGTDCSGCPVGKGPDEDDDSEPSTIGA